MISLTPLTVAIPAYKRAHAILPLLQAIAAQAEPEDDLVVVDDASNDDIERVVAQAGRFRLIRHESNLGMVANWNACLHAARHDWVCIVHHDDDVLPGALQALRRACALAGGPALILHWRDQPELGNQFRCRLAEAGPWAIMNVPTIPSGAVVHRQIVEAAGGFDPQWKYSADMEYFPRICTRFPLVIIESPDVVRYHLHKTNHQYETWLKPDFEEQMQKLQRVVLGYAGLTGAAAEREYERRMAGMYKHMFVSARRLGNRRLFRRMGWRLARGAAGGRRLRLQGAVAAVLGWCPGAGRHLYTHGNLKVSTS